MEQFTASEVRDAITWKYGDKLTRISAMLNAFADLLEAREKAVPVMVVNHVSSAEHDLPIGMKLYAHPVPADAERLEELGRILRGAMIQGDARVIGKNELKHALEILAAHSAQAQPPVQSKYAPPYPDQAQDPFWKVPGMVDTRPKAQPAASVTDAMIMRAVKAWTSNGFGNPGQVFSIYSVAKAMLEAALAAQENPND